MTTARKVKGAPNPPRVCIFCGGRPITKEHIYADWMRDYLLPGGDTAHQVTFLDLRTGRLHAGTGPLQLKGDHRARGLQVVCQRCNNTWMSGIQQRAKPALVPLLTGLGNAPNREHQRRIAAWAAMFTIIYERADPRTACIGELHRRAFMTRQVPDSHWAVWVGRFHGLRHLGTTHHRALLLLNQQHVEPAVPQQGYLALTLGAVGGLSFLTAFSVSRNFRSELVRTLGPDLRESGFCRVWPAAGFTQTFGAGLTDVSFPLTIDLLHARLNAPT